MSTWTGSPTGHAVPAVHDTFRWRDRRYRTVSLELPVVEIGEALQCVVSLVVEVHAVARDVIRAERLEE